MRARYGLSCAVVVGWLLVSPGLAQQGIQWAPTLDVAKQVAGQTNRLVLVHFWADWCKPCMEMEQTVFNRAGVASALEGNFVPVKIVPKQFPHTAEAYGVSRLPTDVVITSGGQLVARLPGSTDPSEYVGRLNQVAMNFKSRAARDYSQIASAAPPAAPDRREARPDGRGYEFPAGQGPGTPRASDDRYAHSVRRQPQWQPSSVGPRYSGQAVADRGNLPPNVNGPQRPPSDYASERPDPGPSPGYQPPSSRIQLPPGNPPLALDGYCPVQLAEKERWVTGNRRWGLRHRGRTYLFAGPEEQSRFYADPDRYAPALSGSDVVIAVEQGQMTPGRREYGVWFPAHGRVYLFASEASFRKFEADPYRYVNAIQQAATDVARRQVGQYNSPSLNSGGQTPGSPYPGRRY